MSSKISLLTSGGGCRPTDQIPVNRPGTGNRRVSVLALAADSYILVGSTDDPVADGTALRAAVLAAGSLTPGGNALSRTNLATVLIAPGVYDVSLADVAIINGLGIPDYVSLASLAHDPRSVLITSSATADGTPTIHNSGAACCNRLIGLTLECTGEGYALHLDAAIDPVANPYSDTYIYRCIISQEGKGFDPLNDWTATFEECDMGTEAFIGGCAFKGTARNCVFGDGNLDLFQGVIEECTFALVNGWAPTEFSGVVRRCKFAPTADEQAAVTLPDGATGEFDRCEFVPTGDGLAVDVAAAGSASTKFVLCDYGFADIAAGIDSQFSLENTPIGFTAPRNANFGTVNGTGALFTQLTVRPTGSTGNASSIQKIATGFATLDFGSIAAGASEDQTITVSGATFDGVYSIPCIVGFIAAPPAGIVWTAFVSAANTVTLRATNVTASPIDPGSTDYSVTIFKVTPPS